MYNDGVQLYYDSAYVTVITMTMASLRGVNRGLRTTTDEGGVNPPKANYGDDMGVNPPQEPYK